MDDFTQFQSISFSVDGAGQVQNLTKALDDEAKAADRADAATRKVSKAKQQMARDAMEASRALQDFAQGGLGGILNNLEGLGRLASKVMPGVTAFFGGPAGLAAAATTVGVAIWALKEPVTDLVGWITSEGNGIPKATDVVGKLEEAIEGIKGRLKELKEGWDGSSASVAEHNRLLGEQAAAEKRLGEAKKERAAVDAQREKESGDDPASAKAVSDAIAKGGGVDAIAAQVAAARPGATNAAQAQLDQVKRERDAAMKAAGSNMQNKGGVNRQFNPQIAEAEAALRKAREDAQAGAQGVVGRALQGDQGAIRDLDNTLPGRGFDAATTEGIAASKAALEAGELQAKRDREWREKQAKERAAARAAREKKNADVAALVEENRDFAHGLGGDMEREAARKAGREQRDADRRVQAEEAANARAAARAPREEAEARDAREGGQIAGIASREFGLQMDDSQTRAVLNQARQYVGGGADPGHAARAAIAEMVQSLTQRLQAAEGALQGIAQGVGQVRGQMQGPATGRFAPEGHAW